MTSALQNRGRPLALIIASIALLAGLIHCPGRGGQPGSDQALKATPAPERAPAQAKSGRELYRQNCARCHSLDHSDVGPAMLGIAAKYADRPQELIAYLKYPVPMDPSRFPMPRLELSDQECLAVADYVLKLPAKAPDILAPPSTRPPAKPPEAPVGEAVFAKTCARCHDWDQTKVGPPLRPALEKFQGRPESLLTFLQDAGRVDEAHPLMPEVAVSGPELQAVVAYLLAEPGQKKDSP